MIDVIIAAVVGFVTGSFFTILFIALLTAGKEERWLI